MNEILKNKKIRLAIILFIVVSAIVVILAIVNYIVKNNTKEVSKEYYTDPISGEQITDSRVQTGGPKTNAKDSSIVGINQLVDQGIASDEAKDIRSLITNYLEKNNIQFNTISFYKDSYLKISKESETPEIYIAKFALDNDTSRNLYLKRVSKGYMNYELYLYTDEELKNEVDNLKFCSVLVCPPEVPEGGNAVDSNYNG
jgi:hypothetical protein